MINFFFILVYLLIIFCYPGGKEPNKEIKQSDFKTPFHLTDFTYLRDTLYTLENSFIEIDISKQKAYVHFRNGDQKEFGVSTGTKRIDKGIETKEGLFVIQTKAAKLRSAQFDNTLMLNWMGFNYGTGLHALLGKKYYKFLGVKKSSHGCVRISRETAHEIYDTIKIGTPVLVHNGSSVVHISFADSSTNFSLLSYKELKDLLPKRYQTIYDGKFFIDNRPKLLVNKNNVSHSGLPIGDWKKIPRRQITTPIHLYVENSLPQMQDLELIKK